MQIIYDRHMVSGFIYEQPLPRVPQVTHCGESVVAHTHTINNHHHEGFELMYLARGSYTWQVENQIVFQNTADLLVTYPGQPHRTACQPHPECHQLWLGVHLGRLGAEGQALADCLRTKQTTLLSNMSEIEPLLRGFVQQVIRNTAHRENVSRRYLALVVSLLIQQLDTTATECKGSTVARSYSIQKALHLMQTTLDQRLTLEQISAAAGCGMTQLCKLFKKELGLSPVAYHLRLRLEAAREALKVPGASVTQVAFDYGFSSSQHFATCFSRAYGTSPKQVSCRRSSKM